MKISVCIATCKRPAQLAALLGDLTRQTRLPDEVVVVDNDASASARMVVNARRRLGAPFPLLYAIEREKNIAHARNRCVELARGDWLAFIDDDERAPAPWLQRLETTARRHLADGVLAPVEPELPRQAPDWIRRGRFYEWPHTRTGMPVPLNHLRFGNVLLRVDALRALDRLFDPAHGLTGGEDGDLLTRLAHSGARILWCDEAPVIEPVVADRLKLSWLLKRALRGGQDFARHARAGRYGPATPLRLTLLFGRSLLQTLAAAGLALLALPLGRHRAAHWLLKVSANVGKLSTFWGLHYREYA